MTISDSPLSYKDCYDAMERALEDAKGIRLRVNRVQDAYHLRMRLNQARAINRKENRRTYDPEHHLYGRSIYDRLMFKIKERTTRDGSPRVYVYLERISDLKPDMVEALSEVEPDDVELQDMPVPVETLSKPRIADIMPMRLGIMRR
jgi:hypothetical protein